MKRRKKPKKTTRIGGDEANTLHSRKAGYHKGGKTRKTYKGGSKKTDYMKEWD